MNIKVFKKIQPDDIIIKVLAYIFLIINLKEKSEIKDIHEAFINSFKNLVAKNIFTFSKVETQEKNKAYYQRTGNKLQEVIKDCIALVNETE